MKKYFVQKIKNFSKTKTAIPWKQAKKMKDFSYPWLDQKPKETSFRALYDNQYLYLRYDVKDSNINIYNQNDNKMDVVQSDRVEVFFRKNKELNPYYGLEIDPNGKVLDYLAMFYRKFDYTWSWPKGHLFIESDVKTDGYCVEVKISLKSLKELGLLVENEIQTGIFRGDCIALPKENNKESTIKWISWVDPKTESPDFHVPSSFGTLELL